MQVEGPEAPSRAPDGAPVSGPSSGDQGVQEGQQTAGAAWGPLTLSTLAALLGAALMASALISWVAANWPHWPVNWRIGLAQGLVGGLALASAILARRSGRVAGPWAEAGAPALTAALGAVAAGALLALVGQVYQTGADTAALFLGWAVLTLPWLLGARTVFLAVLLVALLNVGVALWLSGGPWGFDVLQRTGGGQALIWYVPVLLNAALLVLAECSARVLRDPWRIVPRLLAALVVGWLLMVALAAEGLSAGLAWQALPGVGVLILLAAWGKRRQDIGLLALAALGGFGLACIWLIARIDGVGGLLAVALLLLALAGVLLQGLARAAASMHGVRSGTWLLGVFRYVVLAVVALLLLLVLAWWLSLDEDWLSLLGAALTAAGVLSWRRASGAFPQLAASVVASVGLLLLCAWTGISTSVPLAGRLLFLAVAGGLAYARLSSGAFRWGAAILIAGTWLVLSWPEGRQWALLDGDGDPVSLSAPLYVRLYLLLGLAGLGWWCVTRGRTAWLPLAGALAFLAQCLAWLAPAIGWAQWPALAAVAPVLALAMLVCAWMPALLLWRIQAPLSASWRLWGSAVLAVAGLGWLGAPGVSLGLLWLLLGRQAGRPVLAGAGVAALLASLMLYYYRLELPLLDKAVGLALSGGWLLLAAGLACARLAWWRGAADGSAARVERGAKGGRWTWPVVAGVSALVLVNMAIERHASILAQGRPVVLALAPVDPRSLVQGDYMTLRFQAARDVESLLRQAPPAVADEITRRGSGYAVLQAAPEGGHHPVAVLADLESATQAAASDGMVLAFRLHAGREPWLGTDAWFFPEGQGDRYAQARHGEFRVLPDGRARLLRLLDASRLPLP